MSKQLSPQRIKEAEELAARLYQILGENQTENTDRNRAVIATFGIALHHHDAIVFLMKHGFYSSGGVLVRAVFESYMRGLWLRHCAADAKITNILDGKEQHPSNGTMVTAIQKAVPDFADGTFSLLIKNKAWKVMCDFTHTGGLLLQRWQSEDGVEPNFDPMTLEAYLNDSALFAAMSALELAEMWQDGNARRDAVVELINKKWPPSDNL